jgi:hypothetical protein
MKSKNLFISMATLSTTAIACIDNSSYSFGSYFYVPGSRETVRTCDWIVQNSNKVEIRRANWCEQNVNGTIVKEECPIACLACTSSPTGIPSESFNPSSIPSDEPSSNPTSQPSAEPSLSPTSTPTSSPSAEPTSSPSAHPLITPTAKPSSSPSSVPTLECFDVNNWYDSDGPGFDCTWYSAKDYCTNYGHLYENFGKTANEACCICGGGSHSSDAPSTSPFFASTTAPVAPNSSSPSSNLCVDTPLRLNIVKDEERITRSCTWVGNKNTPQRCSLKGVSAACPVTCGTCSVCEDPVSAPFPDSDGLLFVSNYFAIQTKSVFAS